MNQEEDQSVFKGEVKQWLKSHGLDYKWMADQCGISEITFRNWMSQKSIPPLKQSLLQRVMVQMPAPLQQQADGVPEGIRVDACMSLTISLTRELYSRLERKATERATTVDALVAQAIAELAKEDNAPLTGRIPVRKVVLPPAP